MKIGFNWQRATRQTEHIKTVRCLQAKSDLCLSANTSYEPNNYCSSSAVCKRRLQCLQHWCALKTKLWQLCENMLLHVWSCRIRQRNPLDNTNLNQARNFGRVNIFRAPTLNEQNLLNIQQVNLLDSNQTLLPQFGFEELNVISIGPYQSEKLGPSYVTAAAVSSCSNKVYNWFLFSSGKGSGNCRLGNVTGHWKVFKTDRLASCMLTAC